MKLFNLLCLVTLALAVTAVGQNSKIAVPSAAVKVDSFAAEKELAKLAFQAHGGEKLKAVKTLVVRGSVETTTSAFAQAFPGAFSVVIAGEKYVLELQSVQSFKQSFDGSETYCSIRGITLPPITSLGLPLLRNLGATGYVVTGLPINNKKKRGFRMTAPNATYTDFFLEEKTNQITSYESSFEVNGNNITTSVVIDKSRLVDGVLVPEKYSQRFDLGQLTAYAVFKAKEVVINRDIEDAVFSSSK